MNSTKALLNSCNYYKYIAYYILHIVCRRCCSIQPICRYINHNILQEIYVILADSFLFYLYCIIVLHVPILLLED